MLTATDIAEARTALARYRSSKRIDGTRPALGAALLALEHQDALLNASEALLAIDALSRQQRLDDSPVAFGVEILRILNNVDRAQPSARTDLAATLPHLDAGELADAGRLVGHGRRTP